MSIAGTPMVGVCSTVPQSAGARDPLEAGPGSQSRAGLAAPQQRAQAPRHLPRVDNVGTLTLSM